LIKIAARLSDQAKLVLRIQVEDERSEAPKPLAASWLTAEVGVCKPRLVRFSVHAGVIGEAIAVAAEVELIIGLIEVAAERTSSASLLRSKPVRGETLNTP